MMNNVVLVVSFFLYLNWNFSAFPSFRNIFPVVDVHIKYGQNNQVIPISPKLMMQTAMNILFSFS